MVDSKNTPLGGVIFLHGVFRKNGCYQQNQDHIRMHRMQTQKLRQYEE